MTSKIVVNNIEADTGISTITFINEVTAPTFNGNIVGTAATFSGNVDIAGALTYEDVTNVDSVGIITARSGVNITGGDLTLPDAIIHAGDTNTKIRFPAADTVTIETGGTERLRIDSAGSVGIGTNDPATDFHLHSSSSGSNSEILLTNGDTGSSATDGFKIALNTGAGGEIWNYENDYIRFGTNNSEKLRITSDGKIGVNIFTPQTTFHSSGTTNGQQATFGISSSGLKISTFQKTDNDAGVILDAQQSSNGTLTFATTGTERLRITSVGDLLLSGLTSKNDGRNVRGLTLKSASAISFQNFGANGSRNWRIRPDDLSAWGSLDFCVSPTDNNNTDWPDAASDIVLELKKNKDVKIHDGNLIIGTSGHGISFAATTDGSGTNTSELLDDYETGNWTPILKSNTNVITVTGSQNYYRYIKVGRLVTLFYCINNGTTSGTTGGICRVAGLPFTPSSSTQNNRFMSGDVMFYNTGFKLSHWPVHVHHATGDGSVNFYHKTGPNDAYGGANISSVGSGSYFFWTFTYYTD